MKSKRYAEVHRAAIRWPASAFNYIGIDNEGNTDADYLGERTYGLEPWVKDSYGCHGNLLAKQRKRNHFRRFHPYFSSGKPCHARGHRSQLRSSLTPRPF